MAKVGSILLILGWFGSSIAQDLRSYDTTSHFVIRTGVNVSHWLSQSEKRGEERRNYVTQSNFDTIASIGFDHVRIPVDEVQLWDSVGNKKPRHSRFCTMQYIGPLPQTCASSSICISSGHTTSMPNQMYCGPILLSRKNWWTCGASFRRSCINIRMTNLHMKSSMKQLPRIRKMDKSLQQSFGCDQD